MVLISEMSDNYALARANSEIAIDRARSNANWRSIRQSQLAASEARLSRSLSVPNFRVYQPQSRGLWDYGWNLSTKYRPRWTADELLYDRYYYQRPFYYPYDYDLYYRSPRNAGWYQPYRTWSRLDYPDPYYWRNNRYRDPLTYSRYYGYHTYRPPLSWDSKYDVLDRYYFSPYTKYRISDSWRLYPGGYNPYSPVYYPTCYRPNHYWFLGY